MERIYLERRIAQERRLARRATTAVAQAAHERLAASYAERRAALGPEPARGWLRRLWS
ncbi:hypothetical protein QE361_000312 [Sphingomonas sp. SORGH_AS802]|uniref:hypothetical protein n=1 Tax=unclassified Sphingomonas TaxID=196159 RepID=UPI002859FF2C|nr:MULTISPECIES: hypothetical protein [unclassified Sphingomonas]MDR6127733.1 hypothetical protein [Sphingomonas sp. SORGH_AS_0438]MDR6133354.1 hypothetical protein [Sphingomonas sp. SORGH_AS_0802]